MKEVSDRSLWADLLVMLECKSLVKSDFNRQKYDDRIVSIKRRIRTLNRNSDNNPKRVYLDAEFDGYLEKVEVPSNLQSEEERENWFNSEVKRPMFPYVRGGYSSVWHSFHKLHGVWYVYHRTWLNV